MARFIPNSTMIPNAFIDEAMQLLSDKALRLYLVVARKTTGWGKESDCISISQFMALSGLKDERSVRAGAKELIECGLIGSLKTQGQPTKFYLIGSVKHDAPPASDAPNPLHGMGGVPPTWDVTHKINIKTTNTKTKTSLRKSAKDKDEYPEDFEKFADAIHKFSNKIVKENSLIVVGNVSASGLAKTKMAKSVLDAGWAMLKTQLEYKSIATQGVFVEVNEAYSTQTCSSCGCIGDNSPKGLAGLNKRSWECSHCGALLDRDQNAALNILAAGHRRLAAGIPGL